MGGGRWEVGGGRWGVGGGRWGVGGGGWGVGLQAGVLVGSAETWHQRVAVL